jgi:hypothetical protein
MGLVAAGSAALMSAPLGALAQSRPARGPAAPPRRLSAAAQEELRKQKASTAQAIKAILNFPLPPGTEPGFVLRPVKARRRGG